MTIFLTRIAKYKKWMVFLSVLIVLSGCRDPDFEESPWRVGNYDPGTSGAGPAPLCPAGTKNPIDSTISPFMGGEKYVDLVVDVFTYFRCPNCAQLAESMHKAWSERADLRDYVRINIHHFPLYEHLTPMKIHAATIAMQEQGMDHFWAAHDLMFAGINADPPVLISPEDLRKLAEQRGLDMAQYDAVMEDDVTMKKILWDKGQGKDLGLIGTPGIFICDQKVDSWPNWEKAIDKYLE